MYGTGGAQRRRRLIRAEFMTGAIGCGLLGILTLLQGAGAWIVVGAWLLGLGANYTVLALEAARLSRPNALEEELSGVEIRQALRAATRDQLWILVPLALVFAELRQAKNPANRAG